MLIVFSIRTLILPGYITLDRYFSQIIAAFGDFAILARDKFKLFTKNLNLNHYRGFGIYGVGFIQL